MNEERNVIKTNAIIFFDRNVKSSELSNLLTNFEGDIIINGMLYFDEEITIKCDNLFATVVVSDEVPVNIIGNLYTKRDISAYDVKVNGSVYCGADLNSPEIQVAEDLCVNGDIDSICGCIEVGGNCICNGKVKNACFMGIGDNFKGTVAVTNADILVDICIGN